MTHAVLVIDDEPTLARNIRAYLSERGYEVQVALNGDLELAALGSFKPDVVLLDFHMSGMDGLEVLSRIRASGSHVRVIIMTGHSGVQLAVDAMKAGAYDFLSKPLSLAKLKLLLDKAAGQERLEGHCQSNSDYFSKTSNLDFTAVDIPGFLRVDLSGSMAARSARKFALTMPPQPARAPSV